MFPLSVLKTHAKTILPSNEGWKDTSHIVKDPPKSLYTRRKIKVGDNNDLIDMVEDGGSRTAECINVYARGVNPMVSVQYGNYSQQGSGVKGSAGKLPFRILDGGAFRPPIWRQEDLMPLSRMPRKCTSVPSSIIFPEKKILNSDSIEYFSTGKLMTRDCLTKDVSSNAGFRKDVVNGNVDVSRLIGQTLSVEAESNRTSVSDFGIPEFHLEGGSIQPSFVAPHASKRTSFYQTPQPPVGISEVKNNTSTMPHETTKTFYNAENEINDFDYSHRMASRENISCTGFKHGIKKEMHQSSDNWFRDKIQDTCNISGSAFPTSTISRPCNIPQQNLSKNIPGHFLASNPRDVKAGPMQDKTIRTKQLMQTDFRGKPTIPSSDRAMGHSSRKMLER
jgi:hypothetical protein